MADPETKEKLLAAARQLMRAKGFAATTVDEICQTAGLTKGAFFHYFESKDALGRAAVERFADDFSCALRSAPFHREADAVDRVYGYIDFMVEMGRSTTAGSGCLVGIFAQELADIQPDVRKVCAESFSNWTEQLRELLEEAKRRRAPRVDFDARSVAYHLFAVLEGALILQKATGRPEVVVEHVMHYRRYVESLLGSGEAHRPHHRRQR